ncbi:Mu homology domain-containing protein [Flagelloscypha sp. PMI_526]|nr:Mu homology domain-containing protein [Flagelloscypha sp. PMI_526]
MAIDGLIILDHSNRPIIQSGFRLTSPGYPLFHIDAFTRAVDAAVKLNDVDPVIKVPALNSEVGPSACCHLAVGDVNFLVTHSHLVDPTFAFAFLQTFLLILREYFGSISAAILREHFDIVYQLLEETLDSSGHPLTTSSNALRDIVLPPSLLNKLLGASNLTSAFNVSSAGAAFASPIPWRKAGLRYNNNEIFFDIDEELDAVVNKNGTILSSNVWGKIHTNAKLSGTPDCLLSFTNAHVLTDCSFHPCVRLQRFTRDRALSFVPPDGRFILAEYRYTPSATSTSSSIVLPQNSQKDIIPIPFAIKGTAEYSLSSKEMAFEFTLTTRSHPPASLENASIEWFLGSSAERPNCTVSRGGSGFPTSGRGGFGNTPSSSRKDGSGTWTWDTRQKILRWEISSAPASSSWSIKGTFSTPSSRPANAMQARFLLPQSAKTYSNLAVEQLRVTGETYKPFKGVRGRSTGKVEFRISFV